MGGYCNVGGGDRLQSFGAVTSLDGDAASGCCGGVDGLN